MYVDVFMLNNSLLEFLYKIFYNSIMGCSLNYESLDLIKVPTRDNYIKIATLNYSGLNDSPYEFY